MTCNIAIALILLGVALSNQFQHHLTQLIPTTAEKLPFLAVLYLPKLNTYSIGTLISKKYVLASTNPSADYSVATVYLGFAKNPTFSRNYHYSKGCRIIDAKSVSWEEDVGVVKPTGAFINELALIELDVPVEYSDTIQPVILPSRSTFLLQPGANLNLTKFNLCCPSGTPEYATVQLRSPEKCDLFFGSTFDETEEFCIKTNKSLLSVLGDIQFNHLPVFKGNMLVGIGRTSLTPAICQVTSQTCNYHQVYRSLHTALDWIFENSDIVDPDIEN